MTEVLDITRDFLYSSHMELQPTLKGQLIELRPLKTEDFEELYRAGSDPLVWEQHPINDRYKRDVFLGFHKLAMESGGAFKVIDLKTNQIIGSSRYYDYDPQNKTVIIGYTFLERKYWGKLYNEEMKKLMMDHAFKFVDRILFEVGETNIRSQKAMAKFGAKVIERKILDNKNQLIFEIKKSNWTSLS